MGIFIKDESGTSRIALLLEAIPKPRMSRRDRWAPRPCVRKYFAYKSAIIGISNLEGFQLGDSVMLKFYFGLKKSYSVKKRARLIGQPHQLKPDLDNLVKGILDAYKKQDQTVFYITALKSWAERPKIEIINL